MSINDRCRVLAKRRIGEQMWRKVLERMTQLPQSPERDLLCAVVARAVCDEERIDDVPLQEVPRWVRSVYCRYYCEVLGIAHEALVDAVKAAGAAYAQVADARMEAAALRSRKQPVAAGGA